MNKAFTFAKGHNPSKKGSNLKIEMSLFVSSLNTGSNGNCFYIGNHNEAVLIDAGLSCKETEKRMTTLGLDMEKVKAIFISHEHTDHVSGLSVIAGKYKLPVYAARKTSRNFSQLKEGQFIFDAPNDKEITIGEIHVTGFSKFHDADDPQSFIIRHKETKVGVFTDIGKPCKNVIKYFSECHAAFLEANYDDDMLSNGKYPEYLKKRIRSDHGHLSNLQALELFTQHKSNQLSHIFLSHLSKENNSPTLVKELFEFHAEDTKVIVASRYEQTALYHIQTNNLAKTAQFSANQMTLF